MKASSPMEKDSSNATAHKALDMLRIPSHGELSRGNTGLSGGADLNSSAGDEAATRIKKRRSSIVATERLLASQGIAQDEDSIPKGKIPVINPHNPFYLKWWYFTMVVAMILATTDPIQLAFIDMDGFASPNNVWSGLDFVAIAVFGLDMISKFFLSYNDPEEGMIRDHKRIALHYLRGLFWVDLITTIPIESITLEGLGISNSSKSKRVLYLGLLRWLKLVRLYRIFDLFEMLDHKMVVSQITITLFRNLMLMFYAVHWMGCNLYFIARAEDMTAKTWVDGVQSQFEHYKGWVRYFYSFYFSIVFFTGFGDNDLYPRNPLETSFIAAFLFLSFILQAYILGSITTVMIRGDERSNEFRTRVEALNEFSGAKGIPEQLYETMRSHMELHYHCERTADDHVLKAYPPTIRKKVLRHMYSDVLRNCYLFSGCKARFLDEVLSLARMELFMPHMSILTEGEIVGELMIIVDGEVKGARSGSAAALAVQSNSKRKSDVGDDMLSLGPQRLKSRRNSSVDLINPHASAISRANSLAASRKSTGDGSGILVPYTPGTATGRRRSSVMFDAAATGDEDNKAPVGKTGSGLQRAGTKDSLMTSSIGRNSSHGKSGSSMGSGAFTDSDNANTTINVTSDCVAEVPFFTEVPCLQNFWTGCLVRVLILTKGQLDKLGESYPLQIKQIMNNLREHADEAFRLAVADALATCAPAPCPDVSGVNNDTDGNPISNESRVQGQGISLPEEVEEALHDALAGGQSFTAKSMRRPMTKLKDALPKEQMFQLQRLELLRRVAVKHIRRQEHQQVCTLISAAASADVTKLQQLMAQGMSPSSANYDKRTALMVAAHMGNDSVVKLLLDRRANAHVQDAFGITAMFEAVRMGHNHIIELLKAYHVKLGMDQDRVVALMCTAIYQGDLPTLQRLIKAGGDPNWGDHDQRTPMHAAASEGNLAAIEALVEEGKAVIDVQDRWNATPLDEAREVGSKLVVEYLEPLYDEIKKGKRKSWTNTPWYEQCQKEKRRPTTPPKERKLSRLSMGITDGGYVKRGSMAHLLQTSSAVDNPFAAIGRRGSMMLPSGGAGALATVRLESNPSNFQERSPRHLGLSSRMLSNTMSEEESHPRLASWHGSMMVPSNPGNLPFAGEADFAAFGRQDATQRPSQPGTGLCDGQPAEPVRYGHAGSSSSSSMMMVPLSQQGHEDWLLDHLAHRAQDGRTRNLQGSSDHTQGGSNHLHYSKVHGSNMRDSSHSMMMSPAHSGPPTGCEHPLRAAHSTQSIQGATTHIDQAVTTHVSQGRIPGTQQADAPTQQRTGSAHEGQSGAHMDPSTHPN